MTVTARETFFDTWAWWEVFFDTQAGRALWSKYGGRVHTSVLTPIEMAGKLVERGDASRVDAAIAFILHNSRLHDVRTEQARAAAILRAELRKTKSNAGIVDALILVAAREAGLPLISDDTAYSGQRDVRAD